MNLNKIVENLEQDRFHILGLFVILFSLFYIRNLLEMFLFKLPVFYFALMPTMFFFATFLFGALIISVFAKERIKKVVNVLVLGYVLVLIPPVIDHFIFGRTAVYNFLSSASFSNSLATSFFTMPGAAVGIFVQILLMFSLASLYVLVKTKSIPRAIATYFSLNLLTILMGAHVFVFVFLTFIYWITLIQPIVPPILFPFAIVSAYFYFKKKSVKKAVMLLYIPTILFLVPPFFFKTITQLYVFATGANSFSLAAFYFFLSIITLGIISIREKIPLTPIFKRLASLKTFHFAFIAAAGIYVSKFFSSISIWHSATALFSVLLAWTFGIILNDIYDVEIDKKSKKGRPLITKEILTKTYYSVAVVCAILALGSTLFLASITTLLISIFILISVAYSIPPVRLRDYAFSPVVLGAVSAISFLVGAYANSTTYSPPILLISLLIFIALSLGSTVKDLEDISGDKNAKVRNIFTIYGKEGGKKIVSALIFSSFLVPLVLFMHLQDLAFFIIFGAVAAYLFNKKERTGPVMGLFFLALLYCLLRVPELF